MTTNHHREVDTSIVSVSRRLSKEKIRMDEKPTAAAEKAARPQSPITLALYISLTPEQKETVREKIVELLEGQRKEPNR